MSSSSQSLYVERLEHDLRRILPVLRRVQRGFSLALVISALEADHMEEEEVECAHEKNIMILRFRS